MLSQARRPVLVVGAQSVLETRRIDEIVRALIVLGVPVFMAGMSRGLLGVGTASELQLRHGRTKAFKQADLVIIAGGVLDFRFGYGTAIPFRCKLIVSNRKRADVFKNRTPDLGVIGDSGEFIIGLAKLIVATRATSTPLVAEPSAPAPASTTSSSSSASSSSSTPSPTPWPEWLRTLREAETARDTEIDSLGKVTTPFLSLPPWDFPHFLSPFF